MNGLTIILISADTEWRVVCDHFGTAELEVSPYGQWFITRIASPMGDELQPVIFFHGGWGKIAAAASTQYVIDRWSPRLLVNLGTCGGFEGEIERGAILLVDKTIVYDIIEQMGDFEAHIAHYTTQIDLSWLTPPYPQPVQRALLVSGDRDLLKEEIPILKARYHAIAGDWDSGAIAFVAKRNQQRLLILRGVTDLVGSQGGEAYGKLEVFEEATREIMHRLVEALPVWLEKARGMPGTVLG
jgi:adenosylhomocysteine nucleosidase